MAETLKLVFPHLPKTGGTSLLYHFRQSLGQEHVVSFGPFSRSKRFFSGQYQLEEMPPEQLAKIQVVQGHGVDENTFRLLGNPNFKLMIVLRGVVPLVRSRYNQRVIGAKKRGATLDSPKFLATYPENAISKTLLKLFPSFIDQGAETLEDKAVSVLRKFDYVFTLEQLDNQSKAMMRHYGLRENLEHRRVAGSSKQVLEIQDQDILAHNPVDQAVFEAANHLVDSDGDQHNALGFTPESRAAAIEKIISGRPNPTALQSQCYEALAHALCRNLSAEAALRKLDADGDAAPLRNPSEFREILEPILENKRRKLSEPAQKISANRAAKVGQRLNRLNQSKTFK